MRGQRDLNFSGADTDWVHGQVHARIIQAFAGLEAETLLVNGRRDFRHSAAIAHDAARALPFADAGFDRVLVDAPCTGTGTLRHNPEIRWRLQPSDIDELAQKQKSILANASAAVRRGGRLIYSTCSVEPEENEDVVRDFLSKHANFHPISLDAPVDLQTESGTIRTWPHRQQTDGFFVAGFEREK